MDSIARDVSGSGYSGAAVVAANAAWCRLSLSVGAVTHNLHDWMLAMRGNQTALDYVPAFQQWVYAMLRDGNIDALLSYREVSEYGARAHPSEEHLLPLFVALGAAGENAQITREYDSIANGALGMDAYRFQPTV
jgi:4,5-DOPA dioxygenase extradiol